MDYSLHTNVFAGVDRFYWLPNIRGRIMIFTPGSQRNAGWRISLFFITTCLICATIYGGRSVLANQGATPSPHPIKLGAARQGGENAAGGHQAEHFAVQVRPRLAVRRRGHAAKVGPAAEVLGTHQRYG